MKIEGWCRGKDAAKCMGKGLRGERGRVLELFPSGKDTETPTGHVIPEGHVIIAPKWCEERRGK